MFRELGWVVAFTAILWTLVTLDRGYFAVGGEVLLIGLYYMMKHFSKPAWNMMKETFMELWNGWAA